MGLRKIHASILARRKFVLSAGLLVLFIMFTVLYLAPYKRAITVEASTLGVTMEFTSVQNTWFVQGEILLCKRMQGSPRELRTLLEAQQQRENGDSPCGDGPYAAESLNSETLEWPLGARIKLAWFSDDYPFSIRYLGNSNEEKQSSAAANVSSAESFYLLSSEAINRSGLARYKGKITIGDVPTSGSYDHLLSGRYEVWDLPRFGRSAIKTLSGPLLLGDAASVVRNSSCSSNCHVIGEVIISFDTQNKAMHVVLHSGIADDRLRVDRFGGNRAYFASNWFDRAKNDSALIALSSLLALFVGLSSVATGVGKLHNFYRIHFKRGQ